MPISWRTPSFDDIEGCLEIQPSNRGDGFPDVRSALDSWRRLTKAPFFLSAVVESNPPIKGHRLIGFGSAILVGSQFANEEISNPRPFIAARVIRSLDTENPCPATREMVARANARNGNDVIILYNAWRDGIVSEEERRAVRVILTNSFAEVLAGFRIHRIVAETTNQAATDLHRESAEFRTLADFFEIGHSIHLMTKESATALPGSIANRIFQFSPPALRLRASDQELLLAALDGATDSELAVQLCVGLAAIKARWRSIYAQIAEVMPNLIARTDAEDSRGAQKRHKVLAYVRSHMEELRPYDWSDRAVVGRGAKATIS